MEKLADWIKNANYTVVMTGAGMSTESGVPDFRSNKGIWKDRDPIALASTEALQYNREAFFSFYQLRIKSLEEVKPNNGHYTLADWEHHGLLQSLITQNVDDLHSKAGSRNMAELHGSIAELRCHDCGYQISSEAYLENNTTCPKCGGFFRPNVVLFGEMLPEKAIQFAQQETAKADLFIVLGSSLSVAPASAFPAEAKENGAKLVIINKTTTELDDHADLVIQERSISEVLEETNKFL
ncbi:NAD-dependent protein deacylase [Alteribacillus bidgolensis]|uniref:NAD-dependent protein deacetylase n=1 Tax=Alteribacillus bidgolensis TaxID=930129 RepID=A0A1G8L3K4_9BACI|nr:NAD-dependent protein deacylase [Alteribacillus bidgolensis]SDI49730.1 NAD-dependent deacetylase [Alteribacillus bidgolensis]